jgi:RNA polymerase sigma-70 factor (ECF subfamily)
MREKFPAPSEIKSYQEIVLLKLETVIMVSSMNLELEEDDLNENHHAQDASLIEQARGGNEAAFGDLVKRYEQKLYRVIYRFVSDRELAEDLAQETFLRVYERLDQYDSARRFAPWLFQVAVNLTIDFIRKQKRRKKICHFSERAEDKSFDPGGEDPHTKWELSQEVKHVLGMLPEKYRTVMILKDLENFSHSEIAAVLNRNEGTIRWRLAHAREKFQQLWTMRENLQDVEITEEDDD